jgi:hypothetical protein
MAEFLIKRNDTGPVLEVQLLDAKKAPVPLAGATVVFNMRGEDGTVLVSRAPATVVNATTGVVRFAWRVGDTAVAGEHQGEFEVTFSGGIVETFPKAKTASVNFITVVIPEDAA